MLRCYRECSVPYDIPSSFFRSQKAIQAAAVVLREQPWRQTNYMRLLKLLYLAERRSLQETGKMITWDRISAMERGPVLSAVYDFIKGIDATDWERFIEKRHFDVKLLDDPGAGELSDFEIDTLRRVAAEFADYDEWQLVDWIHKNCPEWKDPGNTSVPMRVESILEHVGMGQHAREILEEARMEARVREHLESVEASLGRSC